MKARLVGKASWSRFSCVSLTNVIDFQARGEVQNPHFGGLEAGGCNMPFSLRLGRGWGLELESDPLLKQSFSLCSLEPTRLGFN